MQADVSVVICAYTEARWVDLRAAISSVEGQSVSPTEVILVVDHNDRLLQRARAQFSGVIVLNNQEARGLSGARNTGVRAAHGSLIAFLDDDAVAAPDWLELLARACDDPSVLGCGGQIEPAWHTGEPFWFPDEFYWVVGCSYRGLPGVQSVVRNLIGSSMCIRREVFESVGFFRSEVGRVGKHPVGCEETELCIRARQRWPQREFLYEPASRVQHTVPPSRARWRYFCLRCFFEGRSKARVAQLAGARDGLSSERAYISTVLPNGVARNLAQVVTKRDLGGLTRVAAICAGLAMTSSGYAAGLCAQALARWTARLSGARAIKVVGPSRLRYYTARFQQEDGD